MRHDFGNVVGALINVGIGDDQQHALGRAFDQAAGGFENRDARAFGADQCAGDVESILGQKVVQVVAGDAAGNVRESAGGPDRHRWRRWFAVWCRFRRGVRLAAEMRSSSARGRGADFHAQAVVGEDFQFFDVVVGLAGHDGVHAAGVVADHAAESAAVVRGGIGREGEMVFFGGGAESVEHDSGLHAGDAAGGIDFENPRHVLGEIEDDGDVAALAGERCAAAAAEQRRAELAAERDRGQNIVGVAGKHDADGNLAVVGAVGGVESASAAVEADFTVEFGRESQRARLRLAPCVHLRGLRFAAWASSANSLACGPVFESVRGRVCRIRLAAHIGDDDPRLVAFHFGIDGDHVLLIVGDDGALIRIGSRDHRVGEF